MSTTIQDFETMLDKNPADWTTRLVYADFLDEPGRNEGRYQRIISELKVHPRFIKRDQIWRFNWQIDAHWINTRVGKGYKPKADPNTYLPLSLWNQIRVTLLWRRDSTTGLMDDAVLTNRINNRHRQVLEMLVLAGWNRLKEEERSRFLDAVRKAAEKSL